MKVATLLRGRGFVITGTWVALVIKCSLAIAASPTEDTILDNATAPQSHRISQKEHGPYWRLLEMVEHMGGGMMPSDQRSIKKITVTIFGEDASTWKKSFLGKESLVYETNDPHVLEAITRFLSFPLRQAIGDFNAYAGADLLGTVIVSTTKDQFTIYITTIGFELGGAHGNLAATFYSWGLGHFLDELCAEKANKHIPRDVLLRLTGESRMNEEREVFEMLKRDSGFRGESENPN